MGTLFGIVFSLIGAAIFYSLAAYVLTREDKDISHYLFITMLLLSGTSEFLAFLELPGPPERTYTLLKFDLSCIALGSYFLLLFADYFREGLNKRFAVLTFIPTALVVVMIFTVMVQGVEMGPYGYAGVYHEMYHLIFSLYGLTYLFATLAIFLYIYRTVEDTLIKAKIKIFIIAVCVVILGGLINMVTLVLVGRIFPILETSMMLFGIIFTLAFRGDSKSK